MKEVKHTDWWNHADPARGMSEALTAIRHRDAERRNGILNNMRLYGSFDLLGYGVEGNQFYSNSLLSLNVIRAVCDTAQAQITRTMPRAMFLTDEGNRKLRRKAELLTRFVDGVMYAAQAHMVFPRAWLDALVFGTGIIKIYDQDTRICIERVFPGEVIVDPGEGRDRAQRTIYQRKLVHKEVVASMFPEHAGAIHAAESAASDDDAYYTQVELAGMIEVTEGWRLGDEGRHVICIEGATLLDEPWPFDRFPFVFMRWSDEMLGFWGKGVAEELRGIQLEINRILRKIQKAIHLLAVPWIFVEQGSMVQQAHITSQVGAIIPFKGTPPIVKANQPISQEVFGHLNWLYARAFDHVGVSSAMAAGDKPPGIASGVGIEKAADIQSGRFAMRHRSYEEAHLEASRWIVELGRHIAEENPDWRVIAPRDRFTVESIKWSEVDMDEDLYTLRAYPTSGFPLHPGDRQERIIELINAGVVDTREARSLLEFPDLAQATALDKAATEAIDAIIERIIDDGEALSPEPFMDLQLFLKRAQAQYNRALANGMVPERHMQMLRVAMETAATMEKAAMAEQQAMQQPHDMGAPLPAGPAGAPPTAAQPGDGML